MVRNVHPLGGARNAFSRRLRSLKLISSLTLVLLLYHASSTLLTFSSDRRAASVQRAVSCSSSFLRERLTPQRSRMCLRKQAMHMSGDLPLLRVSFGNSHGKLQGFMYTRLQMVMVLVQRSLQCGVYFLAIDKGSVHLFNHLKPCHEKQVKGHCRNACTQAFEGGLSTLFRGQPRTPANAPSSRQDLSMSLSTILSF